MPLFRTVTLRKKGLLRGRELFKAQEFEGVFEILNWIILSTDVGSENFKKHGDQALIGKKKYVHNLYGEHEYYNVSDDLPREALIEQPPPEAVDS